MEKFPKSYFGENYRCRDLAVAFLKKYIEAYPHVLASPLLSFDMILGAVHPIRQNSSCTEQEAERLERIVDIVHKQSLSYDGRCSPSASLRI